jgi:hypothetical protein
MLKTLENLLLQSYSTMDISLPERYSQLLAQLVNIQFMWLEEHNIFFFYLHFLRQVFH